MPYTAEQVADTELCRPTLPTTDAGIQEVQMLLGIPSPFLKENPQQLPAHMLNGKPYTLLC
jgi:hypothetical protein